MLYLRLPISLHALTVFFLHNAYQLVVEKYTLQIETTSETVLLVVTSSTLTRISPPQAGARCAQTNGQSEISKIPGFGRVTKEV